MFQTPFFGPWEPPVVVAVYRTGSLVTENRLYMSIRSNLGESLVGVVNRFFEFPEHIVCPTFLAAPSNFLSLPKAIC
jgi:hypothetical protein